MPEGGWLACRAVCSEGCRVEVMDGVAGVTATGAPDGLMD